jgi:hypothetical protein
MAMTMELAHYLVGLLEIPMEAHVVARMAMKKACYCLFAG